MSDNDQRHRLTLSGTFNAPTALENKFARRAFGGFQLSYIFTYASRLPFNVLAGSDLNNDSNNNDRPFGLGRNTGKGFDFASFDLRLSRRFQLAEHLNLELLAEAFNLFNRANFSVPNSTFFAGAVQSANFGRPTAAFDRRQIQFGFRFNF